jgi:hypothetical protein
MPTTNKRSTLQHRKHSATAHSTAYSRLRVLLNDDDCSLASVTRQEFSNFKMRRLKLPDLTDVGRTRAALKVL